MIILAGLKKHFTYLNALYGAYALLSSFKSEKEEYTCCAGKRDIPANIGTIKRSIKKFILVY